MFVSLVLLTAAAKKGKDVALVAGSQQNLSNLYSLDIYGSMTGFGGFKDNTFGGLLDFLSWNVPNFQGGLNNKKCVFKYTKISKVRAMLRSFFRIALATRVLNKDYTVWLDGARLPPSYIWNYLKKSWNTPRVLKCLMINKGFHDKIVKNSLK